jgi:hypothetical protein
VSPSVAVDLDHYWFVQSDEGAGLETELFLLEILALLLETDGLLLID